MREHDVIVAGLNAIGGLRATCSVCGGDRWTPREGIHLLPVDAQDEDDPRRFDLRGPPVVAVACDGCGHTRFFDLAVLLTKT